MSHMKRQPTIARSFSKLPKEDVQEFWSKLVEDLNHEGPPFKETAEWKKVNLKSLFIIG